MANLAGFLKEEIARLSRKELRRETGAMKKASAQYRRHIAALKRQVAKLERQVSVLEKSVYDSRRAAAPAGSAEKRVRFVAKGLKSQRERLGLSAAEYARLVGVSAQSIYNWEREVAHPRAEQVALLAKLRGMGKKQVRVQLERLDAQAARKGSRKS